MDLHLLAPGPALSLWPPLCLCRASHSPLHHRKTKSKSRARRRGRQWWWRAASDSESDTEERPGRCLSDTETAMPGGFENSAMKSSFSLSSLQPSSVSLETPEHARPYNSLRKTCRKDVEKESWRRSWDRKEVTKDEFWNALEPNYLYLMDSNLIDSCKEAGRDLHYNTSTPHDWSLEQFCAEFTELDLWLTSIQETIYSKEENVTDRNLRLSHVEEMHRKTYKRKVFNNQGGRLAARFPELRDEVKWRMTHLNRKWERLEQTVTPRKRSHPDHLTYAIDVDHELNCLRKWLRLTERRLLPLELHATRAWTLTELEVKAKEHQVIQREVELHGKVVCSVLKRCDRLVECEAQVSPGSRRFDAAKSARDLERRWQLLFLRSLEWVCHIDNLLTRRANTKSPGSAICVESDEGEPVLKHRRLSSSPWRHHPPPSHAQDVSDDDDYLMEVSPSLEDMVGPQSELSLSFPPSPPPPSLLNRSSSLQISSAEDVLNENFFQKSEFDHCRRQSVPLDSSRKLFADNDENTRFTSSNRLAPNIGNFYCKHLDTDDGNTESEQDEGLMDLDDKNVEDSSEEEWTFKGAEGCEDSSAQNETSSLCQSTETLSAAPLTRLETLAKDELKKLIDGAEQIAANSPSRKIIRPHTLDMTRAKSKIKVNDWMRKFELEDETAQVESRDASWECTSEEDRHSSGDFNTSVVHCHQSSDVLPPLDSPVLDKASPSTICSSNHSKGSPVVMRTKRKEGSSKRPLSESCLHQLSMSVDRLLQTRSESALNQLDCTPSQSVKMDTSVHGTLSSSTTVEEMPGHPHEGSGGGYSSNSLRKRKTKLRKRTQGRKSDSGSDQREPASPLKSVPVIRRVPTSGTETEEEAESTPHRKCLPKPHFKLGPEGGPVTTFKPHCTEKALSTESSWSEREQAWDNYQEKYVSEAYSEETADQETTRRLLEFGDDYRNFLDSQSDASSLGFSHSHSNFRNGLRQGQHLYRRKRQFGEREGQGPEYFDEESQQIHKIISTSLSQLEFCERNWVALSEASPHMVLATDFAEILTTCKGNISVLNSALKDYENVPEFSNECQEIRGLIERWESLEPRSEQLQKMRSLQREMAALREELLDLNSRVAAVDCCGLQDQAQLDFKIQQIKAEQVNLRERKSQLIDVNTAVHKFFTDSGQQDSAAKLKEDVQDLYYVWEETNKRVSQQLDSLSELSRTWQVFESHLAELRVALREDSNNLRIIDSALQHGSVSQDITSSVIDIAKVLSEKQDISFQSVTGLSSSLSLPGSTEGSLSDSGISDSGSEQECERERRLSALRRLARQLESLLTPDSQAFLDMARRIEQTESELRGLQKTCRELIGRTAATVELRATPDSVLITRGKRSGPQSFLELDGDDGDDPDPGKSSWLWLKRVMQAALPFQVALLAMICVACLLQPHCCDSMNNLNFSLSPQLRYMKGPPPV